MSIVNNEERITLREIPPNSIQGLKGDDGLDGKSAYQSWIDAGNSGTEQDFIDDITGTNGTNAGAGADGSDGDSAYQVWINEGNSGTEQDFIDALTGTNGTNGTNGEKAFLYVGYADDNIGGGFTLTPNSAKKYMAFLSTTSPIASPLVGDFTGLWRRVADGLSAYDIWIGLGNSGSESTFIDSLKGTPGTAGTAGNDGNSSFTYIAYADDVDGNGFVVPGDAFDASKKYIAILDTETEILTPAVTDFIGLWVRYLGDGDRWATTSSTTLTIAGTGTMALTVEAALAYTSGQEVVIAENGNSVNRMTGIVDSYNYATGALVVEVSASNGSGTIDNWAVNLQAGGASATNLTNTPSPTDIELQSSTGGNTNLPLATDTNAGLMSPADKANLVDNQDQVEEVLAGIGFGIDTFDIDKWYSHDADVGDGSVLNYINFPPMKGLVGHLRIETHGTDGVPGRNFVISSADVKATGILTLTGNLTDGDTVEIDGKTYTFQDTLTDVDGNVHIGAAATDTIDNLIAAITLGAGGGTDYATSMTLHPTVTSTAGAGDTMDAEAKTAGGEGNLITTTEVSGTASWGATKLTGGTTNVFDEEPGGFYDNEVPFMTLEFWRACDKVFGVWLENGYVKDIDPA